MDKKLIHIWISDINDILQTYLHEFILKYLIPSDV
jgi:hypothetical protein